MSMTRSLRTRARDLGYGAAWATSSVRGPRSAILMYHSIGAFGGPSAEQFEWQIQKLATTHEIHLLRDLPLATPDARPVAAITFDDGATDNVTVAARILDRLDIRATFFPPSGLLGGSLVTSRGPVAVASAHDLRALHAQGHEIGGHSVSRASLPGLDDDARWREIAGCKRDLEEVLGEPITTFAYPKGRYDAATVDVARACGFERAVTVEERLLHPDDDPLLLPRIYIDASTTRVQFVAKLSPALTRYKRWRRHDG